MNVVPLPGRTPPLPVARRTVLVRGLLALALVLLVLFAAESARHPGARTTERDSLFTPAT